MTDTNYYKSERFIWDNLKVQAGTGVAGIYKSWKETGKVDPFLVSWPSERLLDDSGVPLDGACLMELPEDKTEWSSSIVNFAKKTRSYALLLTERRGKSIQVILESHHGTRSWTIPIMVSGDIRVLGTAVVQDNFHKIGVLWRERVSSEQS